MKPFLTAMPRLAGAISAGVLEVGIFVASHKAEFSLAHRDYDVGATVDAFEHDAEIVAADSRTVV